MRLRVGPAAVLITAICAVFFAGGCGSGSDPGETRVGDLELLPPLSVERADPQVRDQLSAARGRVEDLLARGEATPELAEAMGELGRLCHAYDLPVVAGAAYSNARRLAPRDSRWAYYSGVLSQRAGDPGRAEELFERVLELEPGDPPTLLRLGRLAHERGDPVRARQHFEAALAGDPTCASARYGLGDVARDEGRLAEAVGHFERTLREQPGAVQVHYPLARTLQALGRREEAERHFDLGAARKVKVGSRASCPDPLSAELGRLTTGAAAHLTRGQHASYAGNLGLELEEYRKAVAAAPDDSVARHSLGSALYRSGDFSAAADELREAMRLAPDKADYRVDLGKVLMRMGLVEAAEKEFRGSLEIDLSLVEGRLKLAEIAFQKGRIEDAIAQTSRILEGEPHHREARVLLASSFLKAGRHGDAIAQLGRLLDDHPPDDPAERLKLATLLVSLGDRRRALNHLRIVADTDPRPPVQALAWARIGRVQLMAGELSPAVESLERALKIDPGCAEARAALAQIERRLPP